MSLFGEFILCEGEHVTVYVCLKGFRLDTTLHSTVTVCQQYSMSHAYANVINRK